ncbi:phosphoribosyltransferase [Photobacterium alginatilyticum]|uniref:Hypoxanthine phosphoribosyltransferase n=1 Tax=Photobacterium alginatilyticum TaxID=1775171 RepID=A0ABW9YR41_9GAMM|nr:phosphoribosyltransferase family protein [Photobacterium alginatilyticum]NBI56255.1 hypoxanthine phosphoribosyltransferase [Photobacterium alginatilyticum]
METNKHLGSLVLSQEQVRLGVEIVADKLNKKFAGEEVVVISVVPGGILFTADLVRELKFDVNMDYIACHHTPGASENRSPIVYHQDINIKDKHVILVDDAIETGGTMKRVALFIASEFGVKSVSIATLFVKPNRVNIPVTQYFAYEMENDDMLIGYGLSWENKYQNIPYVSKLIK